MRRGAGRRALARIGISGPRPREPGRRSLPGGSGWAAPALPGVAGERRVRGVPRSFLGGNVVEPGGAECAFLRPSQGGTTTSPATSHRPRPTRASPASHRPEPRETRRTRERGEERDGGDQRRGTRTEASEARSAREGERDAGRGQRCSVRRGPLFFGCSGPTPDVKPRNTTRVTRRPIRSSPYVFTLSIPPRYPARIRGGLSRSVKPSGPA